MRKWIAFGLLACALVSVGATSCEGNPSLNAQRDESVTARTQAFDRAERLYPLPLTQNFPLRQALVEFTEREDLINHPWYTYVLGDNGNIVGYYVTKTPPLNSCNFLSSTEDQGVSGAVLTAPSLDGIYYGGGGSSSNCDEWFFFDLATNALIKIRGVHFYTADQPLRLEADPILVQTQ